MNLNALIDQAKAQEAPWDARKALVASVGHFAWAWAPGAGLVEYYMFGGHLYWAPASNVIDLDTGCRFGRWEGPARPGVLENVRAVWRSPMSRFEEGITT